MAIELRLDDSPLKREILDSPVKQGTEETKVYLVDFATWGATDANPVTSPVINIFDADDVDVTGTHCAGGAAVSNYTQVVFTLTAFAKKQSYLMKVKGTWLSSTMATYCEFIGE